LQEVVDAMTLNEDVTINDYIFWSSTRDGMFNDVRRVTLGTLLDMIELEASHSAVTLWATPSWLSLVGQAISLALATTSTAGAMSASDKTKLDGVAANANNYSHPNHTWEVTSTGEGATAMHATAISNKTAKTTLDGTEEILINDGGTLKKTTAQYIADLGGGSGSSTPAWSDKQIQFNDWGVLGVDSAFRWDKTFNWLLLWSLEDTISGSIVFTYGGSLYDLLWNSWIDLDWGNIFAYYPTWGSFKIRNTDVGFNSSLDVSSLTDERTHTLPDVSGTLAVQWGAARVTTITSSATPTINTDSCDAVTITALAVAITSMTTNLTGTPTNFQKLLIRIKDNGTARAITWWASFEAKWTALPTTTVISKVLTVWFIYDTVTSKWWCVASSQEA
jgi:hypothetical protein